jgi:hypothetical protein
MRLGTHALTIAIPLAWLAHATAQSGHYGPPSGHYIRQLNMTAHMTADGAAKLHCLNCGDDAPVVDIVREQ